MDGGPGRNEEAREDAPVPVPEDPPVPVPDAAPRPWHRPVPGWARPLVPVAENLAPTLRDPDVLFRLLLVLSVVLRVIWLDVPPNKTIFDEAYYVNAARVILGETPPEGGKYGDRELGLDPNKEHPPLGKLAIAASMTVFGDNGLGWRVPAVIAGMLVLVALWLVIQAAGGTKWLALLAVFLVSLDNLSFVHGRIAVLDVMALAPALIASWLALRRRWALAAVAMAIALLVKLTALYAIGAIGLLWLLQVAPGWWSARRIVLRELRGPVTFVVLTVVLFLGGLGLLDARWSEFKNPFEHVAHMVNYGANLDQPVGTVGICPKADSRPLQWLSNDCQIQYYRSDVSVRAGEELKARVSKIDFRGAMNELLLGALPIAMLFTAWFAWTRRDGTSLWALSWAAANFLPYLLLSVISNRIMYLYYFLPTVPAVAAAIAVLLLRSRLPRFVLWGFLVLYVIGFLAYFPFRQLPS
jgi:4-amino-4-deoxy-L-arabinose transferase-like glycosyltransferase